MDVDKVIPSPPKQRELINGDHHVLVKVRGHSHQEIG